MAAESVDAGIGEAAMIKSLSTLDRILGAGMRGFCIACFVALMTVLSGVVLIRFWPIAKLSWSDEVVEFLMAWLVFIGAAALWRENAHFRIEAVLERVKPMRYGWILAATVEAVSAVFIIMFTYYSFQLTIAARDVSPILSWPKPIWYAAMPISGVLMVGYSIAYSIQMARCTFKRKGLISQEYESLVEEIDSNERPQN